jgi:predicted XRE-type DNA-binding protein
MMTNIPGYEGLYGCDKEGNIFSLPRIVRRKYKLNKNKIFEWHLRLKKIRSCIRKDGYLGVSLRKNKKKKSLLVHRLIGITFLELKEKEYINHIDGNKANNKIENLEVCSHSYNIKHDFKMGLRSNKGENNPRYFINNEIKNKVRELLKTGLSQQKISNIVGINQGSVSKIKLNKL